VFNPIHITAKVTAVLEELGVSYFIAGSLASTFHGMIRTTQDSDLVSKFSLNHIKQFLIALEEDFYIEREMIVNAITNHSSFNIIHRESLFKVDVFIPRLDLFEEEQFNRTKRQVLSLEPKIEAYVASAEDTLLAKLRWYRMGGEVSERQWRDVIGMVIVQGDALDTMYLTRMADELNIRDLLDKALVD
jgi:hypothetical protein